MMWKSIFLVVAAFFYIISHSTPFFSYFIFSLFKCVCVVFHSSYKLLIIVYFVLDFRTFFLFFRFLSIRFPFFRNSIFFSQFFELCVIFVASLFPFFKKPRLFRHRFAYTYITIANTYNTIKQAKYKVKVYISQTCTIKWQKIKTGDK